jgi:cytochrome c
MTPTSLNAGAHLRRQGWIFWRLVALCRGSIEQDSPMRLWKFLPLLLLAATGISHAANAKHGAVVFLRCAACHSADKGGGDGLGPNLFGVVGRKAASRKGFSYSPALEKSGITWTNDKLKLWVAHPARLVPGTQMSFAGLANPTDVDDVVAYLDTLK